MSTRKISIGLAMAVTANAVMVGESQLKLELVVKCILQWDDDSLCPVQHHHGWLIMDDIPLPKTF
jgi:hypothetical protein